MHVALKSQRDWERILEAEGMPREPRPVRLWGQGGTRADRERAEADRLRWRAAEAYYARARAYFWEREEVGWPAPHERRAWGLHVFNGLDDQEIAERLGWPSQRTPAAHGGWSPGAQRVHAILVRHRKAAGLTRDGGLVGPRQRAARR